MSKAERSPDSAIENEDELSGHVARPSMRGALHAWAVLPFLIAGFFLVVAAGAEARWPIIAYVLSVVACLGTSAVYHRIEWGPTWYARMRRLDHAMIFVLIVGTWTPLCLVACQGRDIGTLFTALCVMAGAGVAVTLFWTGAPKWLRSLLYLGVGWTGAFAVPHVYATMGAVGVGLLALGGLLYSVGALAYAFQWPNPSPRVFGYHEIFHALVILAAAAHFALVATAIA